MEGQRRSKCGGWRGGSWLIGYLRDAADAVMCCRLGKAQRESGDTLANALMKLMRLNNGRGKDPVEEALKDIRDHDIYFQIEGLLASEKAKKEQSTELLASAN